MSTKRLKRHYNGHGLCRVIPDPRYLTLQTDGNGTLVANKTSGYIGDIISLTATPTAYSASFNRYEITGAVLTGNDFAFQGEDVTAKAYFNIPIVRTLTLQTDGHGTLTADKVTGYAGQTVTLTPTYNTYYRFKNYQNTGGSINGNTFTFSDADATAQANFSANAFTASGKINNNSYTATGLYINFPTTYAVATYHTNNIPSTWYNSNWNPSNASAYKITFNGSGATFGSKATFNRAWNPVACNLNLANDGTNVSSFNFNKSGFTAIDWTGRWNLNVYTSNKQKTWNINGRITNDKIQSPTGFFSANSTITFTATGYAP